PAFGSEVRPEITLKIRGRNMTSFATTIEQEVSLLIEDYPGDRRCPLELLRFLCRFPCTRFNQLAIIHALEKEKDRLLITLLAFSLARVS
ncbi:MAG: hypothetical protein V1767_01305, partial [Chloroflexota bacterium]